jgi:hypothetical protein
MINLSAVRATGSKPRVHGNGFIQLDLTEETRLHIWGDPRIPRQKVSTQIHDHVFGFESTIIVGRLINVVYTAVPSKNGAFSVYIPEIRDREDTVLNDTMLRVDVAPVHTDVVQWHNMRALYTIRPFEFHESFAPDGPAATIITKDAPTQAQGAEKAPRVLVPVGQEPDNEFNRYDADEDLLWKIIEETLKRRGR